LNDVAQALLNKEIPDVSSNDNAIETSVIEFDIFGELIYKGAVHMVFSFFEVRYGNSTFL
jgi:hypothetical protein